MADISNFDDVIDSRYVEARIEALTSEQDSFIADFENATAAMEEARSIWEEADSITQHNGVDPSGELTAELDEAAQELVSFWNLEDERETGETITEQATNALSAFRNASDTFKGDEELTTLIAFREEMEDYCPDWQHGAPLIRDSYWTEYVQELLAEIGDIPRDLPGYIAIDWDKTAGNIQVDYTSGEFDGVTYWTR